MSDDALAQKIREDQIDVLIDLRHAHDGLSIVCLRAQARAGTGE